MVNNFCKQIYLKTEVNNMAVKQLAKTLFVRKNTRLKTKIFLSNAL